MLALKIQEKSGKKLKDFKALIILDEDIKKSIQILKLKVNQFAEKFEFYN